MKLEGAAFGPVFSAVVVMENKSILKKSGVKDSKKLIQKERITVTKNFNACFRLWNWSIFSKRSR